MQTSPDIAATLTSFTTVDIDCADCQAMESINAFMLEKGITARNHLISGAPTSQILSYLVNQDMFDELQRLADNAGMVMTIYVDDLAFSSNNKISVSVKERIRKIIGKYGYRLSAGKEKMHTKLYPKQVTGVIIGKNGTLKVKNSLRMKVLHELELLKKEPDNKDIRMRLRGLVTAARQVDKVKFCNVRQFAFDGTIIRPDELKGGKNRAAAKKKH